MCCTKKTPHRTWFGKMAGPCSSKAPRVLWALAAEVVFGGGGPRSRPWLSHWGDET